MNNRSAQIKRFGSPDEITIVETPFPTLAQGEVMVRIAASTVSATDIFIRKGIYPLLKSNPPITLGYDFVGRVTQVSEGCRIFKVGDRVCGICMTGGNDDYIKLQESLLHSVPEQIALEDAACATLSGITAFQMFMQFAKVKPESKILVHGGSGAIGDTLLQLGKLNRCKMVTTASGSKHPWIKEKFDVEVLDYKSKTYWEDLRQVADTGFDAIFDFTNQRSFKTSFDLLKSNGTVTTYAVYTSSLSIQKKNIANFIRFGLDFAAMMLKLKYWSFFSKGKSAKFYGVLDSRKEFPEKFRNDLNLIHNMIITGTLKPKIFKTFNLSEVRQAHEILQAAQVHGQIVIIND